MSSFVYAISVMFTSGVIESQSRTLQTGFGLPNLQSCMKGLKYKTCSFTQMYLKSPGFFNNSIVYIEISLN